MVEPVTLTVLGGVVATEGIKFLYGQAAELLKAWRGRKHGSGDVSVPIQTSPALDAAPAETAPDLEVLAAEENALVALSGALSPYALGLAEIDLHNPELAAAAGKLRSLLEAVYHQRLTFRGEARERTGATVTVRQALGEVSGHVIGAHADLKHGSEVHVEQDVQTVMEDGSLTGFQGTVGSGENPV